MKQILIAIFLFCMSCSSPKHLHNSPLGDGGGRGAGVFDKEGHRGCRGLMPENTIPAMMKALELGVTTLEMDAVVTADSQVILSHEPCCKHDMTTKSDGTTRTEEEERKYNIFKMTYAETQTFDVGLKPNLRF